jgi:aryl-alcohol dehydrogenase-like predicted oxidoreductase
VDTRTLGQDLHVSAIGFGAMGMSQSYGPGPGPDANIALLRPIPGTRRPDRLQENLGAADVSLTSDDLAEIDAATAQVQIQGGRYSEQAESMTNR